jgi:hypothetical protein
MVFKRRGWRVLVASWRRAVSIAVNELRKGRLLVDCFLMLARGFADRFPQNRPDGSC